MNLRLRFLPAVFSVSLLAMPASPAQQKATNPNPEGCVWKIAKGGRTVYLAGSVHLLREEDYPVSSTYDDAYADSDAIVFEVDMAEMMDPAVAMKVQRLGMYDADDSLDKHLKPETIERIREYLSGHESGGMLSLALPRMKPGMIFLSISSLEAMRMKARADLGLESTYFQKAKADGKKTSGLETIEYQMGLFDEFSDAEIDELISQTLEDAKEMPKVLGEMIAHWHAGDAEKLDEVLNREMSRAKEGDRLKKLLLTDRNKNWVPKIEKALAGGKNILFLVGAGHLVGKDGVVDLLQKRGHTVEKLKPSAAAAPAKARAAEKKKAA
jgi:uncharacterized protein YbaP (TraB family)